ncbi:MAG: AsmA family protein, partial [Alphaproteobacteria bacterium]
MKKVLIGVGAVIVLVVVVLVAAPFFIPVDVYRQQVVDGVREATGRELALRGDIRLSLLPALALEADDVSFANAPGAREPAMASFEKVRLRLQVWPLLSGQLKVDTFVLVKPVIHLEVDKEGRPNWVFAGAAAAEAKKARDDESGEGVEVGEMPDLSLGEVRLEDGLITFFDARNGQAIEVRNIAMAIDLPDMDSPFNADGSFVWNDQKVSLTLNSGPLRALKEGAPTTLELALESAPITLR